MSLDFLREVERLSHTQVSACLQCHKCSAGCPIGKETDLRSSQIIRLVHFGQEETLLSSRAIWLCASCEACTARCPMDIDVAAVMDALRMLAVRRKASLADKKVERFNRLFLKSVSRHGRVFEAGMMTGYALRTGALFGNLSKGVKMLMKGRLALAPTKSGSRKALKAAMKKAAREEKTR